MASIAEWIQKIKTAIYGEEVRGAIWQSLEAMNNEVEAINVDEDQIQTNKTNIATNTAAITALNSSSGVQTLTLSEATAGGNASFYYKIGHVVTVFIDCTPSAGGTPVTVATLPSGYRPPATIRSALTPVARDSTLTNIGTAFGAIDPQGRIQFYMGYARRIFFTLTYSVV